MPSESFSQAQRWRLEGTTLRDCDVKNLNSRWRPTSISTNDAATVELIVWFVILKHFINLPFFINA